MVVQAKQKIDWKENHIYIYILTSSGRRFANGDIAKANGICDCLTRSFAFGIVYIVERIKRGLQLPWSWQTKSVPAKGGSRPGAFVMNGPWIFSWLCSKTCI